MPKKSYFEMLYRIYRNNCKDERSFEEWVKDIFKEWFKDLFENEEEFKEWLEEDFSGEERLFGGKKF